MKKIKKLLKKKRSERDINRAEHIQAFNTYKEANKASGFNESAQQLSRQAGQGGFF